MKIIQTFGSKRTITKHIYIYAIYLGNGAVILSLNLAMWGTALEDHINHLNTD